jgi:alpha-glucuronidase
MRRLLSLALFTALSILARADDGYRLWLRYDPIADPALRQSYATAARHLVLATPTGTDSPTLTAARDELTTALPSLLGSATTASVAITFEKLPSSPTASPAALGDEGFSLSLRGTDTIVISAARDIGALYGAFALLRHFQTHRPLATLAQTSAPKISRRLLNHWGQPRPFRRARLRRQISLGMGQAPRRTQPALPRLRPRQRLPRPQRRRPRQRQRQRPVPHRALPRQVRRPRDCLPPLRHPRLPDGPLQRPHRDRLKLKTADPLDPAVITWWNDKAAEIYRAIPDFGGFLVKANSEGQPGPQAYHRTHADGANLLAAALAPHGGIVIWRAFVYDNKVPDDRHKQAYNEFVPLDGKFLPNVVVQVKNGPIDFMPREPFHPLFGAMPKTPLALEVQITQEYLGGSTELAYLAPMWREVLDADTHRPTARTTVARVIERHLSPSPCS